ncbi:MAG: hypothetical protein PVJ57_05515 [Phycisphaerae bacterium]
MRNRFFCGCTLAAFVAVTMASAAFAGDTGSSTQDQVARLEALLAAQQDQIQSLEQQVVAAQQAGADAGRTDAMRQQIREILGEQEFRESLMPSMLQAGYDGGFFIRSSDDKFLLKMKGATQFRWTHYATRSDNRYLFPRRERDDRTGFDLQRTHLAFMGHAYDPNLTYLIEFQADAPDGYDVVASCAWVNYRFADEMQFRAGLISLPSTRQQTTCMFHQQSIDRPLTDAVFSLGYGIGVEFWGQLFDKRLEYRLAVANGVAEGERAYAGRTITNDPAENDSNPAILFRLVWHALGEDPTNDFFSMDDRAHHESPALDIGFHYAFNDNYADRAGATRLPFPRRTPLLGGFGLTDSQGMQMNQFGLDAGFKYMGFSATGEYIVRVLDVRRAWRTPYTPWWLLTGDDSTVAQHGAYVQLGYFLPIPGLEDKLEAVGRVGGISTLADDQEGTWEYSVGMNYYFNDDVKLQADVTKVSEVPISSGYSSLAEVNDDALIFRVQFQVAF